MAKAFAQNKAFKVFAKTNGRCFYCNKIAEEIDHFVSRAFHVREEITTLNPDDVENLVPACKSCNMKKSDKAPEEFIGNSYICWDRSYRANKRIGVDAYNFYEYRPRKPFVSFDWVLFKEKYYV